jgi:hypothetical protein
LDFARVVLTHPKLSGILQVKRVNEGRLLDRANSYFASFDGSILNQYAKPN